jgi:hypothetical protein
MRASTPQKALRLTLRAVRQTTAQKNFSARIFQENEKYQIISMTYIRSLLTKLYVKFLQRTISNVDSLSV